MQIAEFRTKFPDYDDMPDDELTRRLHAKDYSDMRLGEFSTKFGTAPAQQVRPIAEELTVARERVFVEPREPGIGPGFEPLVDPAYAFKPVRPLTKREIFIGDLRKIRDEPGTTEQKEAKAIVRTRARLGERVSEIQAIAQDPTTRRRLRENEEELKGKFLAKTYRRWERGEVMVVGGGLFLADTLTKYSVLGAIATKTGVRKTVKEWSRMMHQALQEPEMQPVIENTFDKYFGGAIETGPFLGAAIGSAALSGGATLPSAISGFLIAYGVEGNNIYQTNLDQGRSERESRIRGIVGGMINGGIEIAGGGGAKYLKAIRLSTLTKLGKAKYFSRRVLHTALSEGLKEELPQELVGMILGGDPPRKADGSIDYKAVASRLIDAGIMGTILGGAIDAPMSAYGITKLPALDKGIIVDIGNGRMTIPGVEHAEARIIAKESGSGVNPWVKQVTTKSNKDRTLIIQFDETKDGLWIGEVNKNIPNSDVYFIHDMAEAKIFLAKSGYNHIIFDALDVTKENIKELTKDFKGEVSIGIRGLKELKPINVYRSVDTGKLFPIRLDHKETAFRLEPTKDGVKLYDRETNEEVVLDKKATKEAKKDIDSKFFIDLNNVKTYDSVQAMAEDRGLKYKLGHDFSHFGPGVFEEPSAEVRPEKIMMADVFAELDKKYTPDELEAGYREWGQTIQGQFEFSNIPERREITKGLFARLLLSNSPNTTAIMEEVLVETKFTVDEAAGRELGLSPIQVQDKLTQAEDRYRLLKNKDIDKRTVADKKELAFLSKKDPETRKTNRESIEALVTDYTSDKPVVRNLWKKPKKPSKKELLRKGHAIPEQMNMSDGERRDLQEEVTRTATKPGKRSMAEMSKDEMIKWVDYLEAELAARGEVYEDQPTIMPQLIERLEIATKVPIGKIRSYLRQSRIGGLWTDLVRVERWIEALDGYEEGPLYQHVWKRTKQADELRNVNIGREQTAFFDMIENQNIDSAVWCGAKETIREGLELTPFEQIGVYLLAQNDNGFRYLTKGMAITEEDISLVEDKLTEEQLAVATWLDDQYRTQWPVLRAAAIMAGIDPKLLEQELNYSPIQRIDLAEGEDVDFVSLLTEQFNQQSLKPEDGFLEKRKKRAVGEIELDAGVIYMKNIQRIETFKAMAPIAKDVGKIFNNPQFKKALNNATDKRGAKIMNTWLRDTIRGFMSGPTTEHAKLISIMRRNGIIYAIGYNVPSVMRQTLSLQNAIAVDPLMLKYVPANLYAATVGDYEAMERFVDSRTNLRSTREYARDLRKMWDASALGKRLAGKKPFSEHATSWIKWTDNRTVVVAWKSLYDVAMEKTKGNEQAAIEFADKYVTRTQPMANMKDLPHFFRGGTIERLLSTFQNQINNNLNFYVHDIIGTRIAGKISNTEVAYRVMWSYVLPAIMFGIIGRGGLPIDIDEEGGISISLKKLLIDLTTYPIATLMLAGRLINRMIRGWGNSSTIGEIAPEEAIKTVQAMKRGDIGGTIKHAAATYGAATGRIPAQAIRTVGGVMDLAAGTTRDPRRLIYTQWALDQERVTTPSERRRSGPGKRISKGKPPSRPR